MKKKKIITATALSLSLLLITAMFTGCLSSGDDESSPSPDATENGSEYESEDNAAVTDDPSGEDDDKEQTLEEKLDGLTEDEYGDLNLTVTLDEDSEYTPGSSIPINVTIENTGEETIVYVLGSGSYVTPTALFADAEELQTVRPEDQSGAATMDYRTEELEPGEALEFTLYLMAIEPNDSFDDYTYELNQEDTYIAELSWDELSERYEELVEASAGEYECGVYFLYYVKDATGDEGGGTEVIDGATGYAKALFTVTIVED